MTPSCYFCGTDKDVSPARIPVPANGAIVPGFVCTSGSCLSRLAARTERYEERA